MAQMWSTRDHLTVQSEIPGLTWLLRERDDDHHECLRFYHTIFFFGLLLFLLLDLFHRDYFRFWFVWASHPFRLLLLLLLLLLTLINTYKVYIYPFINRYKIQSHCFYSSLVMFLPPHSSGGKRRRRREEEGLLLIYSLYLWHHPSWWQVVLDRGGVPPSFNLYTEGQPAIWMHAPITHHFTDCVQLFSWTRVGD